MSRPTVATIADMQVSFRVTVDEHARLRAAAAREHRSMSSQIRKVLLDYLEEVEAAESSQAA